MPIPRTPDERAEKAARLKGRGWELSKIAEHLGVSLTTVKRDLKRVGDVDPQLPPGIPEATGRFRDPVQTAPDDLNQAPEPDPHATGLVEEAQAGLAALGGDEPDPIPIAEAGEAHELEVERPAPGDFDGREAEAVYLTTPQLIDLVRESWESAWYIQYTPTAEEIATVSFAGIMGPFRSRQQAVNRAKAAGFVVPAEPERPKLELNVEEDVQVVRREVEALEKQYELTPDDELAHEIITHLVKSEPVPKEIRPALTRVHEQVAALVHAQMRRDGLVRPEDLVAHAELYAKRAFLEIRVRER